MLFRSLYYSEMSLSQVALGKQVKLDLSFKFSYDVKHPADMYGTPTLYGGYDYTPLKIQTDASKTLAQKQNEAITMLPKVFASQGYEVETANPPFPDYSWDFVEEPFLGLDHITAEGISGRYSDWWKKTRYVDGNTGFGAIISCNMMPLSALQSFRELLPGLTEEQYQSLTKGDALEADTIDTSDIVLIAPAGGITANRAASAKAVSDEKNFSVARTWK